MDFIERLPTFGGYDSILVVVDCLSKYAHFSALKHPFTAPTMASIFVRDVVKLHAIPRSIISDYDRVFMSHFGASYSSCKELFFTEVLSINLKPTVKPR